MFLKSLSHKHTLNAVFQGLWHTGLPQCSWMRAMARLLCAVVVMMVVMARWHAQGPGLEVKVHG